MRLPQLQGVVERRLLVNYRVDPEVMARHVPEPFRLQLVDGQAVAGICLIRLGHLRPNGFPAWMGARSENAAHRVAVEWDTPDGPVRGVYIPRRDTQSLLNTFVGGRIFPGKHDRARFEVDERADTLRVAFTSLDGAASVAVAVEVTPELDSRLFADVGAASRFFEAGALGYSATSRCDRFDGLELRTQAWHVEPARVVEARSSFFDDPTCFPPGSATLDCALVMRDIPVTWHALASLRAAHEPGERRVTAR